jgi:drug/metabolite transporter (DMT)-like permease
MRIEGRAAPAAGSPFWRKPVGFSLHLKGDHSVPGETSQRRRGVLLVLIAAVMWSLAGVFARTLSHLDLWTVLAWRASLGAASISVVGIIEWGAGRMDESFGFGWLSPVLALLALVAIAAYTAAVMTTTIADVLIIYAMLPFVAAGLGLLVNRERVSGRTMIASAVALVGIAIMVASGLGSGRLLGQALSALMTVAFAGMVVLQRRRPGASIIAANAIGAFGAGLVGFTMSPHPAISPHDFGVLFLFGLTTIGLGFVLFMEGAKLIPSAEAGLISLLDVVLGPLWVFLAFGENPGGPTALGGAIVVGAAVWRMAPDLRPEKAL